MTKDAILLTGPLGLGHEMMARCCARLLERSGWRTRRLDSMSLLGPWSGGVGERAFNRLVAIPGLYDGLHFAHLRTGSRLADRMDRASRARLVPALRAELKRQPGRPGAQRIRHRGLGLGCAQGRGAWAADGRAVYGRGGAPDLGRGGHRSVPGDVGGGRGGGPALPTPGAGRGGAATGTAEFYAAPSQGQARNALGVPPGDFCVLVMDSGWGFGPLVEMVSALAEAGVHVLAVAGRDRRIERRLRELAARAPRVTPFGFTDRIPELMAAADVVLALPGANTCSEARVVGRHLLLLDVMPGHGRDNLLHELELGGADTCLLTPGGVTASVLALRDGSRRVPASPAPRWEPAYVAALQRIGLDLQPWKEPSPHAAHAISQPAVL